MRQVCESVRCVWQRGQEWLRQAIEESQTCRSCSGKVTPWEHICPTCGASDPGTVPVSPGMLAAVVGTVVVLILLCLTLLI